MSKKKELNKKKSYVYTMGLKRIILDISIFILTIVGALVVIYTDLDMLGIILILIGFLFSFWRKLFYLLLKKIFGL